MSWAAISSVWEEIMVFRRVGSSSVGAKFLQMLGLSELSESLKCSDRVLRERRRKGSAFGEVSGGAIEQCESRLLPASSSLSGGILTIKGSDGWNDIATVNFINNQMWVYVTSVPTTGLPSVATHSKYYPTSSVTSISFFGYSGNDQFSNGTSKPSTADGGIGNDTLYGGSSVDVFHGGADKDTLYGRDGNDDLYGDGGDDKLYGGKGQDGLFGGDGTDKMYGEDGADRFLYSNDTSEAYDSTTADAIITFWKGDIQWKENDIEAVDAGLRVLHDKTANDNLLEDRYRNPLFFIRYHVRPEGVPKWAIADNMGGGRIRFYDEALTTADRAAVNTVHEVGHNWQPDYTDQGWNSLSGWRYNATGKNPDVNKYALSGDGAWWYLKSATFAREYGTRNSHEDWSTAWESYFVFNTPRLKNVYNVQQLPSSKVLFLNDFFKVQTLKA